MASNWGWVDDLKLRDIESVELRNKIAYLAAITAIVHISTDQAHRLWVDAKIEDLSNRVDDLERRIEALEAGDNDFVILLLQGLLASAIALPAAWLVSEFMVMSFGGLMRVGIRKRAWTNQFGNRRFADPSVGQRQLDAWKQHSEDLYAATRKHKVIRSLKEGHGRNLSDGVTNEAISLMLYGTEPTAPTRSPSAGLKTDSVTYWTRLSHPATRMQSMVTRFAQDVHWLQERDIPPLDATMPLLMKSGVNLLPSSERWLSTPLEGILHADEWRELDTTTLEDIANERVAHVWLTQFVASFVHPTPQVDDAYFQGGARPGESTPYHRDALGGDPVRRETPYRVKKAWFNRKLVWSSPRERARAAALVGILKRGPAFEETYMAVAAGRVSVDPDQWRAQEATIRFSDIKVLYDSPVLADARLDYAFILLAQDILRVRTKDFPRELHEAITSFLPPTILDRLWQALASAGQTQSRP